MQQSTEGNPYQKHFPADRVQALRIFDARTLGRKVRGALPYLGYRLRRRAPEAVGNDAVRLDTWWGPVVLHAHSSSITERIRKTGVYDLDLCLAIRRAVRPGMTVVNIGANVGLFSLLAARALRGRGTVYAFEPDPRSFALLQMNAAQYPDLIKPQPLAVGDQEKDISLWLDAAEPGDSSLAAQNTGDAKETHVHMVTLDGFLSTRGARADVVIMDVQGAEPLVFSGMQDTMRGSDAITILFECSPKYSENMGISVSAIPPLLHAAGLRMRHMNTNRLPDPEHEWDALVASCLRVKNGYGFCNIVAEKR